MVFRHKTLHLTAEQTGKERRRKRLAFHAVITGVGAGATFPYKKDPKDSNIRIAPSFPTPEEMAMATDLFVLCVKMVSVDKLLESK